MLHDPPATSADSDPDAHYLGPPSTNPRDRCRISVIIPARNEADFLGKTLDALAPLSILETIVVDGHSSDATADVARERGAAVLTSRPGRAVQMNAGAHRACGDVLLFLHADTLPPPDLVGAVARVLERRGVVAGAFRLRVDSPARTFRLIERSVNLRSRMLRMPYGDQAIFVPADVFHAVGGYPETPIMEEVLLIRRLRRLGRIGLADACVRTSARRWQRAGIWKATWINQACLVGFRLGISPDRLARWRARWTGSTDRYESTGTSAEPGSTTTERASIPIPTSDQPAPGSGESVPETITLRRSTDSSHPA